MSCRRWKPSLERDQTAGQISTVAGNSQKFDGSGIDIPILSAYESKPSKISRTLLASKRDVVSSPLVFSRLLSLTLGSLWTNGLQELAHFARSRSE